MLSHWQQTVECTGKSAWPPITDGIACYLDFTRSTIPVYSAAGTLAPSTETVDADGTLVPWSTGLITQATTNTARLEQYGVLVEPTRTNLALQSRNLDTTWSTQGSTVASDAVIGPDGQLAFQVKETTDNTIHCVYQSISFTTGTAYTFTFYAKANARQYVAFYVATSVFPDNMQALFLLTGAGSVVDTVGSPTTTSITAVGGGWYRCRMTATADGTGAANVLLCVSKNAALADMGYAGTTGSGAYITDVQVEVGSAPSSYIPTTTGSVQRTGESIIYAGGANALLAAGSMFTVFRPTALQTAYIAELFVNASNRISLYEDGSAKPTLYIRTTAGDQVAPLAATSALSVGTTSVISASWTANDARLYTNGGDEKSDTSCAMPEGSFTIVIGDYGGGGFPAFGNMGAVLYFNRTLSAAEHLVVSNWLRARLGAL